MDWDDKIPEDLKYIWRTNFEIMNEIGNIRFCCTMIPIDAANLEIEKIDTADASQYLACPAIYARVKRKNGKYSCQLVFARTQVVPKDMTMPRAKLLAAVLNTTTGHVVKLSFRKYVKKWLKLSDSQIVLHWINSIRFVMKQWVRNSH